MGQMCLTFDAGERVQRKWDHNMSRIDKIQQVERDRHTSG